MKVYYKILYVISLCLLITSCTYDEYDTGITDYNIYIESITSYQNGSRADIIDKTSFGEGDTILFNSFGKHISFYFILQFLRYQSTICCLCLLHTPLHN